MAVRTKKKGWFKVCPEKWIFGSTREEMTSSERGVWIDFLALAYMNDPRGQIDFFTYKRLANQLNISVKLLKSTIQKATYYEKIELKEKRTGPDLNEKNKKNSTACDQLDTKSNTLESTRSKIGLPLRTIKILKWNEYQSEYLRQKPYRERKFDEEENVEDEEEQEEKLQNSGPKSVTQVTDRGEERRKEEIRGDKSRQDSISPNKEPSNSPLPSNSNSFNEEGMTIKEQFLSLLKGYERYPFNEIQDSLLFDITVEECPNINILKQTKKKIEWWKDHPGALKEKADPRGKLLEWLKEEAKFKKRGGPQKVGKILEGLEDADHRAWIKRGLLGDSKKRAE